MPSREGLLIKQIQKTTEKFDGDCAHGVSSAIVEVAGKPANGHAQQCNDENICDAAQGPFTCDLYDQICCEAKQHGKADEAQKDGDAQARISAMLALAHLIENVLGIQVQQKQGADESQQTGYDGAEELKH